MRKKFFDAFDPENPKGSRSAENNFYDALERLRKFEERLTPLEKSVIAPLLKLEKTYSQNHSLPFEGEIFKGEVEDPHFLKSQASVDYSVDNEESVGTWEDYKSYKGIA
jgi:hypothetical protein